MRRYLGELCAAPSAADVAAFEASELRQLPRWLKLVHYAFEFVDVPAHEREAWLARRNWYYAGHPIDLSRPLLFRDEYRFIEALYGMSEPDRRAWRAFLTRWQGRSGEHDRASAAREWLRRLGVKGEVLTTDEHELLDGYRRVPHRKQGELRDAIREETAWPAARVPQLTAEEATLLADFGGLDDDPKILIRMLVAKPIMINVVIRMMTKMTSEEMDALVAEETAAASATVSRN